MSQITRNLLLIISGAFFSVSLFAESLIERMNLSPDIRWAIHFWRYELLKIDNNAITIGNLCVGSFLLMIGFVIAKRLSHKLATQVLPKFMPDKSMRGTVQSLSFYFLLLLLSLFALKVANVPLSIFTLVGGAVAIGVGFGSQNIVNNFISGLILMIERPIKLGDFVEVDGIAGTVAEIGFRSTQILLPTNTHIIVPNSSFLEKNVMNWTLHNEIIRVNVTVGVAYGSPTKLVRDLIEKAVSEDNRVLKDPEPVVLFTEFGDNALNFEVVYWVAVRKIIDRRKMQSDIRYRIDELFRESKVTISFPQRDVHLDSVTPIQVQMVPPTDPV